MLIKKNKTRYPNGVVPFPVSAQQNTKKNPPTKMPTLTQKLREREREIGSRRVRSRNGN